MRNSPVDGFGETHIFFGLISDPEAFISAFTFLVVLRVVCLGKQSKVRNESHASVREQTEPCVCVGAAPFVPVGLPSKP